MSEDLRPAIIAALKTVQDPEIPVDIYELGLIYKLEIHPSGDVEVDMTLTAPGCPVAGEMPGMVQAAVEAVAGVRSALVRLVWDPPWDRAKMSEEAQLQLGMF
jgi:FeS assembly SUF system protein